MTKVFCSTEGDDSTPIYYTQRGREDNTSGAHFDGEIEELEWPVDEYFRYRKLKEPNAEEALLFLITELGELVEAYIEKHPGALPLPKLTLDGAISLGKVADIAVSEKSGWVRNNDRIKINNISDEVGDVLMMLIKFAAKLNIDPVEAMFSKMEKKGWKR